MIVTEKKRIKINTACVVNPVFITWINTLGGRDNWLFHTIQTEGLQTSEAGTFEPLTEDLEQSRGQIVDLSIFAQPQLILFAVLDNEDIQGLKTMLYSVNVEVLVNPDTWTTDGPKWQTYRPIPASFKIIDTDEVRSEISITINLPYINNQQQ